jgi:hypothetical protein
MWSPSTCSPRCLALLLLLYIQMLLLPLYIRVLILLCVCPDATRYMEPVNVLASLPTCALHLRDAHLILLYMCPHTAICVSPYCYICVPILLTAIYVSSYCYIYMLSGMWSPSTCSPRCLHASVSAAVRLSMTSAKASAGGLLCDVETAESNKLLC